MKIIILIGVLLYSNLNFAFDISFNYSITPTIDYQCGSNKVNMALHFSYSDMYDDYLSNFKKSTDNWNQTSINKMEYMIPNFTSIQVNFKCYEDVSDSLSRTLFNPYSGQFKLNPFFYAERRLMQNDFTLYTEFDVADFNFCSKYYHLELVLMDKNNNKVIFSYNFHSNLNSPNTANSYSLLIRDNILSTTSSLALESNTTTKKYDLKFNSDTTSSTLNYFSYSVFIDNTMVYTDAKNINNQDVLASLDIPDGFHVIQCILNNPSTGEEKVLTLEVDDIMLENVPLGSSGLMPLPQTSCCVTFEPEPGKKYWLSAWVSEEHTLPVMKFENSEVNLVCRDVSDREIKRFKFIPEGDIIEDWQRVSGEFVIPENTYTVSLELLHLNSEAASYFDDVRIHPFNGSMKSYVYNAQTLQLEAELDDNNFATFYEYDQEGKLTRIKKETERGIKTIQESRMNTSK
jgi:hypothetical protein